MTSRERLIAALNHQQTDRPPIDLGATGQTGINASTLYRLRKELGLKEQRIRVIEPAQMLGEVEDDLLKALQVDVIGLWNKVNFYGYKNENWKPWEMDDGTPVWMGADFAYDEDEKGTKWLYPQGDRTAQYSAMMPKGGSFFDGAPREAFDMELEEEDLTPLEDFKDDFQIASEEDARYWEHQSLDLYQNTEYGIVGLLGGAGLGDVAIVPGPSSKHPKGIRRVDDWLLAHILYPDYIREIFRYQTDIMLKNLEIYRQAVGERIQVIYCNGYLDLRHGFWKPEGSDAWKGSVPQSLQTILQRNQRLGSQAHQLEDVLSYLRSCLRPVGRFFRNGDGLSESAAAFCKRNGHAKDQGEIRQPFHFLGRRCGHPEHAALRHSRRGTAAGPGTHRCSWQRRRICI